MPTEKPRFQAYLPPELMERVNNYCLEEHVTQSQLGVIALTSFFRENYVGCELTPVQIQKLKTISEKNFRSISDQIRLFIAQGIDEDL